MTNLEMRLVWLQSWWIASELIRRHPSMGLIHTHPGGGTYDCLAIRDWNHPGDFGIQLNRAGSIHVGAGDGSVSWEEERQSDDRRELVRRIEREANLLAPSSTPPTTPSTLVFRLCYQLLLLGLNERETWNVFNARIDTSGYQDSAGDLAGFESAERALVTPGRQHPLGEPLYDFWKVARGEEVLGVLDVQGTLHLRGKDPVDLMTRFNHYGRSIQLTGAWLWSALTAGDQAP